MAVSPERSNLESAGANNGVRRRATSRKILYRSGLAVVLAAGFGLLPSASRAQEERPQIFTGERKAARKKDAGPRAVAVLQQSANGKSSLVPIAILINGKFWDASAYKANPVPMALETGTVYEVERTGNSQGLFTVGSALHSTAANASTPWIGTGAWVPEASEKPYAPAKAENVPKGIDPTDDRPRLTRNPQPAAGSEKGSAAPAPGQGAKESTPQPQASSSPPSSGQASSGDEPPRLKRPAEDTSSGGSQPPAGSSQTSAPAGDAKPTTGQAGQGQASQPGAGKSEDPGEKSAEAKLPESDSGAAEGNRPRLRRGKPTQPFSDEDFPGYGKPGVKTTSAKSAEAADKAKVQLTPAISDAGGPTPHPFNFDWLKDEEADRRKQITELAKQKLQGYLDAQAKRRITPKPAAATQGRHAQPVKTAEPILSNVQMTTYDLWVSNQPIMVFSAEGHVPPPATPGEGYSDVPYFIVLVARTDIYNNLLPLYSGVTDRSHLDVTPRLELVDAVDADGDGHGELLFKETSDAGTGWVIYRATADKLWKMYDSLSAE